MDASPSRDRVSARLSQLRDAYPDVEVERTRLGVSAAEYERVVSASNGVVKVGVRVRDGEGRVLGVRGGDGWVLPAAAVPAGVSIRETARKEVTRAAGVSCTVDDLTRVAVVRVDDADNEDHAPVYRLYALFDATHRDGDPRAGDARWLDATPTVGPVV